jgi:hypothetical protein
MIAKETNAPVEEFKGDSNRIINFLKQEVNSQAVVATASLFGWKSLSTQCNVLYVDGDQASKESLAKSFAECEIPSIIIGGTLGDIASGIEEATKLISPPDMDNFDRSLRRLVLRKNSTPRTSVSVSPFRHGQSISLKGEESKGSAGVFLSPTDGTEECYLLTASHVLAVTDAQSTTDVITPGGLDILTMLLSTLTSKQDKTEYINLLLKRKEERCGTLAWHHIGSTENGWRSDWALARLDTEWRGVNGSWHQDSDLAVEYHVARGRTVAESFSGSAGVLNCRDPTAGELCCKDGATTGSTSGRIGETQARLFRKGTADSADPKKDRGNIDVCKLLLMNPKEIPDTHPRDWDKVCKPGDSGSAVFCADEESNGWIWVGQLSSRMNTDDGRAVGLVVPQSEVLRSIKKTTGRTWGLAI